MAGKHSKADDYEGQSDNTGKAKVPNKNKVTTREVKGVVKPESRLRVAGYVKKHEEDKKKGKK